MGATAGRKDDQSIWKGSGGIHNGGGGATGVVASKWGLGVFRSILGNDLHYEASEHFMRAPERVAVMAEMFSCSFQMRRDAM